MKQAILLIALALPLCGQVKVTQQGNQKITIDIDGKPFSEFFIGPDTHKPYLAPLRTANGVVVTRTIAASGSLTATSTATISGATNPSRRAPTKARAMSFW